MAHKCQQNPLRKKLDWSYNGYGYDHVTVYVFKDPNKTFKIR